MHVYHEGFQGIISSFIRETNHQPGMAINNVGLFLFRLL